MCFFVLIDLTYVVDMHTVNEIISVLERINITKELLETTRLGKHVNELRRKTSDPSLARRAKVLVKRWRDLVIPTVASPGHTGSNRSSAERQVRRLGGTPLTSPALSRQVVSPAVNSPRPPSRPAWGGYESDSQDVILVDDEPPPAAAPTAAALLANTHKPLTPPVKRPPSPEPLYDEKKAKRDKKPKKKRGHSRAGSGTEATGPVAAPAPALGPGALGPGAPLPAPPGPAPHAWAARNGTHERRRNGTKRDALDSYAALVNRMPPAGAKKVKTTKELLEQIQSRGSKPPASPASPRSPRSPASPDVMLIEPDPVVKVDSPLRNGGASPPRLPSPAPPPEPMEPLEEPRDYHECTCPPASPGASPAPASPGTCPAGARTRVRPRHVHALHHALLPGVNGTRAPALPHRFAVRPAADPERPGLFASVVPLYKYSDYADDYCAKNMSRVPLCPHLPWTSFAPPPPDLPPPPEPPPLRPYPEPEPEPAEQDGDDDLRPPVKREPKEEVIVEAEMVSAPPLEPSERLKAPLLTPEDETQFGATPRPEPAAAEQFASSAPQHRSVPRTKPEPGGAALLQAACQAAAAAPFLYDELQAAPVLPRAALSSDAALEEALAAADTARDELGRPARPERFAEWHECARLGELVALPYVVID